MSQPEYHRPATLEEAFRLAGDVPGALYVAGGTDLLVQMHGGEVPPAALVSLRGIAALRGIQVDSDGARVGGGVTLADVVRHPGLAAHHPVLCDAARTVGSPQIRNVATLGGNLCNASPCACTAPALLVLGARVRLQGPEGERELALEEFLLGPGETALRPAELLVQVQLPPDEPSDRAVFIKVGRVGMDLAKASVAVWMRREGGLRRRVRVAAGSVAPVPLRLHEAERILEGGPLDGPRLAAAREAACRAVAPISDLRSTESYRRQLVGTLLERALRLLAAPEAA